MWLRRSSEGGRSGTLAHAVGTARSLLDLVAEANLAELTSLETVMTEWTSQKLLPNALLNVLWDTLQGLQPAMAAAADRRGALALLNMAAASDGTLLRVKTDLLIKQVHSSKADLDLARHGYVALQRVAASGPVAPRAAKAILGSAEKLLVECPSDATDAWYATAEQALNAAFAVGDAPERWSTDVLRKMGSAAFAPEEEGASEPPTSVDPTTLSRLIFSLGHVAIKTVAHIEACEKMMGKKRAAMAEGTVAKKGGAKKGSKEAQEEEDALAQELGSSVAQAEADADYLVALGEKLLAPNELLGAWAPLVVAACANADGEFGVEVRAAAVLTLCKFMCVSASFCEAQLQLLFSVLQVRRTHTP
jgi:condensin complex subunit 1